MENEILKWSSIIDDMNIPSNIKLTLKLYCDKLYNIQETEPINLSNINLHVDSIDYLIMLTLKIFEKLNLEDKSITLIDDGYKEDETIIDVKKDTIPDYDNLIIDAVSKKFNEILKNKKELKFHLFISSVITIGETGFDTRIIIKHMIK